MTFSTKSIASWSIIILILMQFIPLNRINPPARPKIQLPYTIKSSLQKACYDCHSYETQWTQITYIAPASWLACSIVSSGRTALNFSTLNNNETRTPSLTKKIRNMVQKGSAHQQLYYLLKPEAQLSISETKSLLQWLTTQENS
jgi:hypothetical protein